MQQRTDALALAAGVDHQHHRSAQQTGDLRGGPAGDADGVRIDAAVEQAHHAFDHGDVATVAAMQEERADEVLPHQHGVQIAARPPGGQRMIAGIDEVGAHLERRDAVPGPPQRPHQAGGDGGLAATRRGRGDDDGGHAHADPLTMPNLTIRCRADPCGRRPSGV